MGRRTEIGGVRGGGGGRRESGRKRCWNKNYGGKCGAVGNIVLNRKIGILINTRGLSIKGHEGTGTLRGSRGKGGR